MNDVQFHNFQKNNIVVAFELNPGSEKTLVVLKNLKKKSGRLIAKITHHYAPLSNTILSYCLNVFLEKFIIEWR